MVKNCTLRTEGPTPAGSPITSSPCAICSGSGLPRAFATLATRGFIPWRNLVIAAIVLWNTVYLESAVAAIRETGQVVPDKTLVHLGAQFRTNGGVTPTVVLSQHSEYLPMKIIYKTLLSTVLAVSAFPISAATITNITFTSNGNTFQNDTIPGPTGPFSATAPLGFTATTNLAQPFLNAADSSLTLNYGSYYAIAFLGFGSHVGTGSVSFLLNGITPVSQVVSFPTPGLASPVFANFALPGGDAVTISSTGLSADRIQLLADGAGLTPGGGADAFYLFNFTAGSSSQVPEPATATFFAAGLAVMLIAARRRSQP